MASAGQRVGNRLPDLKFEYAASAALIALMVGLLIYGAVWKTGGASQHPPLPQRKGWGEGVDADREDFQPDDDERAVIRMMIEDLNASYEGGSLTEPDYRQRLRVLNARLTELARSDTA